jgi:hypothetical protein
MHSILGSPANDGLVAEESQSYPIAIHDNQLGFQTYNYSHEYMGDRDNAKVRELVADWADNAKSYRKKVIR